MSFLVFLNQNSRFYRDFTIFGRQKTCKKAKISIIQPFFELYLRSTHQNTSQVDRGYEFDIGLWFKPLINQNKPKMAKNDKKFNFSIL